MIDFGLSRCLGSARSHQVVLRCCPRPANAAAEGPGADRVSASERGAITRALAARSDVVVTNFATGVMDRLGLGADEPQALNPDLLYVSASGLGRTGSEVRAVAYGTLSNGSRD